jgi:hypothetical protein
MLVKSELWLLFLLFLIFSHISLLVRVVHRVILIQPTDLPN